MTMGGLRFEMTDVFEFFCAHATQWPLPQGSDQRCLSCLVLALTVGEPVVKYSHY